jgi:hypothetical protein
LSSAAGRTVLVAPPLQAAHPDPERPQVRKDLLMLPRPSKIWPVKPLSPPLTLAKGLRLEDTKAQGAVCEAKTHMNSAIRTPPVLFLLQNLKFHRNSRKNQKNANKNLLDFLF